MLIKIYEAILCVFVYGWNRSCSTTSLRFMQSIMIFFNHTCSLKNVLKAQNLYQGMMTNRYGVLLFFPSPNLSNSVQI